MRAAACLLIAIALPHVLPAADPDPSADPLTVTKQWKVLFAPGRKTQGVRPLAAKGPLQPLADLQFTGPKPGHPFILGEFAADGTWGIDNGGVLRVQGTNAALKLARAENFELEGTIELGEEGGWFLLVGWDQGRGYSISNIGFRESPSPWFITEYRGSAAIAEAHQEVAKHTWRRAQPFQLTLKNQELNLRVGKFDVLKQQVLPNYSEGDVVLGVYDTRYGPRPLRIRALRIRAIE